MERRAGRRLERLAWSGLRFGGTAVRYMSGMWHCTKNFIAMHNIDTMFV